MEKILLISDADYADNDKTLAVVLRQSLLRAMLFLMSSDVVESIKDDLSARCADDDDGSCKISYAIINEAIGQIPLDKSRHKVLSLKSNIVF